jgi:hypothetical protein
MFVYINLGSVLAWENFMFSIIDVIQFHIIDMAIPGAYVKVSAQLVPYSLQVK